MLLSLSFLLFVWIAGFFAVPPYRRILLRRPICEIPPALEVSLAPRFFRFVHVLSILLMLAMAFVGAWALTAPLIWLQQQVLRQQDSVAIINNLNFVFAFPAFFLSLAFTNAIYLLIISRFPAHEMYQALKQSPKVEPRWEIGQRIVARNRRMAVTMLRFFWFTGTLIIIPIFNNYIHIRQSGIEINSLGAFGEEHIAWRQVGKAELYAISSEGDKPRFEPHFFLTTRSGRVVSILDKFTFPIAPPLEEVKAIASVARQKGVAIKVRPLSPTDLRVLGTETSTYRSPERSLWSYVESLPGVKRP